eukprot:1850657-Pleurochrysis_carterae.AAC.1
MRERTSRCAYACARMRAERIEDDRSRDRQRKSESKMAREEHRSARNYGIVEKRSENETHMPDEEVVESCLSGVL